MIKRFRFFIFFTLFYVLNAQTTDRWDLYECRWHALIKITENTSEYLCQGALIGQKTVISLASWVLPRDNLTDILSNSTIQINLGWKNDTKKSQYTKMSTKQIATEQYINGSALDEDDLCILFIERIPNWSPFISPIFLPTQKEYEELQLFHKLLPVCSVLNDTHFGHYVNRLKTIESHRCKGFYSDTTTNEHYIMCVLINDYAKNDTLLLTYGDPITHHFKNHGNTLLGLFKRLGNVTHPTVFTTLAKHIDWITNLTE